MDENTENMMRATYVVQGNKAVMFGNTAGGSKEVYTFDTEAEFNAAIAAGTIPDGALVVKTYDGDEVPEGLESVEKVAMDDQVVVKQDDISKFATIQVIKDSVKIWDGKNLGNGVTSKQWAEIGAGTFYGMSLVDYWEINGIKWRYAHTNYWLNTGDTPCTTPHIAIVPDTSLYDYVMNDTNTTETAYAGSKMFQTGLEQAKSIINAAFGEEHILNCRRLLSTASTNGTITNYAWYDRKVELMNEVMLYGARFFSKKITSSEHDFSNSPDASQLELFILRHDLINIRSNYWTRDVGINAYFTMNHLYGMPYQDPASKSHGVRPAFGICA